jgi:hypothetical protein
LRGLRAGWVFRDVREVYWFTVRDDRIVNWWDGG